MGKKKGKGKKGGNKSKTSKPALDPAVVKATAKADDEAVKKRSECVQGVAWVVTIKDWFEKNRAALFDLLRKLDKNRSGKVQCATFQQALHELKTPLKPEDVETFSNALDFEDKGDVEYCRKAKLLQCYGGGLHELALQGLERILLDHRHDLAEIEEQHVAVIAQIKLAAAPKPKATKEEVENEDGAGNNSDNGTIDVTADDEETTAADDGGPTDGGDDDQNDDDNNNDDDDDDGDDDAD